MAALGLEGCQPVVPLPPRVIAPATLVVSGDTRGWLVPCGCTSNQSGGLLRRAAYVDQLRKQHEVLLVDVGGAPGGTSEYDVFRFEAILRGEVEMQIAAHNLGSVEASLGAKTLRDLQLRTGVPFISANLVDARGELLQPAMKNLAIGGEQVAIIGVTSAKTTGEGIRVLEPKGAILKALKDASPKPDRMIVLAYLPEQELEALAEQLPEAAAVIGGPTGQAVSPKRAGPTVLAAATNKGKFLVELPLASRNDDALGRVVELGPSIADDERQTANLKRYLQELAERDFSPADTSFGPAKTLSGSGGRIAGSDACRDCHAAEHREWTQSRHASAWETLVEKGFHVDPYCQHCHTTGYGRPGGFQSVRQSAPLGGVGCESCHGPAAEHVSDAKIRTPWNAHDRCLDCHDHENSPHFDFAVYWKKIYHGKEASP
jgi:hypothetical protein